MATKPDDNVKKSEKQKLWDQISQRPEYLILERMRVNGFWPYGTPIPEDPPEEVKERAELVGKKAQLLKTALTVKDPEKALKEENLRRIKESRERRAEKKKLRDKQAKERREIWRHKKLADVVHTGLGHSAGLEGKKSDEARLQKLGLPVFHTAAELSLALGMPLKDLRFLTYHRRGAALVHYHRYGIPKKTGGVRNISAPKAKLKKAQGFVLEKILVKIPASTHAHGFVDQKSVVTNARPHVGKAVVVNMDLKDFFPTITFRRVKGLFRKMGYSEQVATVLALLTTEPPRLLVDLDGKKIHVALGDRQLPQGASTSPHITNLICHRLDARLAGLAKRHGFAFTRYADDLTFSSESGKGVGRLLKSARAIVQAEGLTENDKKTRVMRKSRQQEVTGVVVNTKPSVPREDVKRLRATLHNAAKNGLQKENRDGHPDFAAHLAGKVAWVKMVDPKKGAALALLLQRALAKG